MRRPSFRFGPVLFIYQFYFQNLAHRLGVANLNLAFVSLRASSKPLMYFPVYCLKGECSVCLKIRFDCFGAFFTVKSNFAYELSHPICSQLCSIL